MYFFLFFSSSSSSLPFSFFPLLPPSSPEERLSIAFASHMRIINREHYVRGLAAHASTKIENGVTGTDHTETTDLELAIERLGIISR